jgi:hypothetical protein
MGSFPACTAQKDSVPTTIQADLIFPGNDTYAPSPFFPIVVAIRNVTIGMALKLSLTVLVTRDTKGVLNTVFNGPFLDPTTQEMETPATDPYFYIYTGNINDDPVVPSNKNLDGIYDISIDLSVANCSAEGESGHLPQITRGRSFTIATGSKEADIAEAVRGCNYLSIGFEVEETGNNGTCGILKNMEPSKECGVYNQFANQVATNVSNHILRNFGCKEGKWQNLTDFCPSIAARSCQASGLIAASVGSLLALVLLV